MKKFKMEINIKNVIFVSITFLLFACLVYLFPYSGDDWAWGSQIGLDRLRTFFKNYNGRYAGNLLVMALTRSKALDIIFTSGVITLACFLPKFYATSKKFFLLPLSLALFLIMPKEIWVQAVTWTAGFSNYFPPIVFSMIYLVTIKNIFEDSPPAYKKYVPVFATLTGFLSSLFMENVTLYVLALSAFVILFTFIKFKKIYLTHILNFAGCALGAILMFTNGAYSAIANEADTYRSTAFTKGLVNTVLSHVKIINEQLFIKNIPFLCVVSVLCILSVVIYLKNNSNKNLKNASLIATFINLFSLGIICFKNEFSYWLIDINTTRASDKTNLFVFFFIGIYFLSVVAISAICVSDKKKMLKIQFILFSIPVLVFPLIFVNPIGPRCFLPAYFLGVVFCVLMADFVSENIKSREAFNLSLTTSLSAVCAVAFAFLISIYMPIHCYDIKRNEYAILQAQAGEKTITLCKLPYGSYVWTGDPNKAPWDERYKLFYGIDENVKFELVDYKEFDKEVE